MGDGESYLWKEHSRIRLNEADRMEQGTLLTG